MKRPLRRVGIALLVAALCFAVTFCVPLADHLILFPSTAAIDTHRAVRKTLPFENGELEVWTATSQLTQQQGRAETFVLRFYGNADRADRWVAAEAEAWNGRAVEIWA